MRHPRQKTLLLFHMLLVSVLLLHIRPTHASKVSLLPCQNRRHSRPDRTPLAHPTTTATTTTIVRGGSSQARRWERMDGKSMDHNNGNSNSLSRSALAASGAKTHGKACSFYIWDAPSAFFYKWCHYLVKDCIYEGVGGRKFVRIEPGSILQLLYPCGRYSQDRCLLCGGNKKDHIALAWVPFLYSPYDRWMDKTTKAGTVLEPKYPLEQQKAMYKAQRRRRRRNKFKSAPKVDPSESTRVYAFHKQYVQEVPRTKTEWQKLKKKLLRDQENGDRPMEVRVIPDKKIAYLVPARNVGAKAKTVKHTQQQQQDEAPPGTRDSMLYMYTRWLALRAVDRMVLYQEEENERIRRAAKETDCCP